jgi:phage terminase large subunit GpA-like protein
MKRRENFGKHLPKDIAIITAGVDVQDNRLEVEIIGWGKDEESWSLDYQVIYGDPSTPDLWNDLDKILNQTFIHSRDLGNFAITAACVDSGGHYTDHVINYCFERKHKRIFAIKGSSNGSGVPIWPPRASQSKRLKKPVYIVGVNDAKETLMQRLRIEKSNDNKPTAGYWHFPIERDQEWFNQITSEVVKTKYVKGRPVRSWQPRKEGIPTEGLDCRVYAFAALRGLIRNWKLDLNKLAAKLAEIPLRVSDDQIQGQKSLNQPRIRRTRSRGIT